MTDGEMVLMRIAKDLGKTLGEMELMTAREFQLWMQFHQAEMGIQTNEDISASLFEKFGGKNEQHHRKTVR